MLCYYEMVIDNVEAYSLFLTHEEAADFMDACEEEGSQIEVTFFKEVTVEQALELDLEYSYKIEVIGAYLMPNYKPKNWISIERKLKRRFPYLFN